MAQPSGSLTITSKDPALGTAGKKITATWRWLHLPAQLYGLPLEEDTKRTLNRVLQGGSFQVRGAVTPFLVVDSVPEKAWSSSHVLSTYLLNKYFPNITEVFLGLSCRALDCKIIWVLKTVLPQFPNHHHHSPPPKKSYKGRIRTRFQVSGREVPENPTCPNLPAGRGETLTWM